MQFLIWPADRSGQQFSLISVAFLHEKVEVKKQ